MKSQSIKLLSAVTLFVLLLTACSVGQPAGSDPAQNEPSERVSSRDERESSAVENDPSNADHTLVDIDG